MLAGFIDGLVAARRARFARGAPTRSIHQQGSATSGGSWPLQVVEQNGSIPDGIGYRPAERDDIGRLDDEVDVVPLHGKLDQPVPNRWQPRAKARWGGIGCPLNQVE